MHAGGKTETNKLFRADTLLVLDFTVCVSPQPGPRPPPVQ